MLKFVLMPSRTGPREHFGDGPLLGIGLEHENLDRLRSGQPIVFDLAALGWELRPLQQGPDPSASRTAGRVLILAGRDKADLARQVGVEKVPEVPPGHEVVLTRRLPAGEG